MRMKKKSRPYRKMPSAMPGTQSGNPLWKQQSLHKMMKTKKGRHPVVEMVSSYGFLLENASLRRRKHWILYQSLTDLLQEPKHFTRRINSWHYSRCRNNNVSYRSVLLSNVYNICFTSIKCACPTNECSFSLMCDTFIIVPTAQEETRIIAYFRSFCDNSFNLFIVAIQSRHLSSLNYWCEKDIVFKKVVTNSDVCSQDQNMQIQ